jgi:hypothetical protein
MDGKVMRESANCPWLGRCLHHVSIQLNHWTVGNKCIDVMAIEQKAERELQED